MVFDKDVDEIMKEVCIEVEKRYQMKFLVIGTDKGLYAFSSSIRSNLQCIQNSVDHQRY